MSIFYGILIPQIAMLFGPTGDNLLVGRPLPARTITLMMNAALPLTIQAYLDDFPFGNITPPNSQLLVPALVLSVQPNFVYATTVLYALLSAVLIYLYMRPAAEPLTIRSVLIGTHEIAAPAEIETVDNANNGIDDLSKETLINKSIGYYDSMVRQDGVTHRTILEINSDQHTVIPPIVQRIFEYI
jgi:hypothetical protein